jgi:hypothetical protein
MDETGLEFEPLPMLDTTEAYLALIDRIATENFGALGLVGGNLLFAVQDVAV